MSSETAPRAPALIARGLVKRFKTGRTHIEVLKSVDFRNLDDLTQFAGRLTTTEFLAQHIHSELSRQFAAEFQGSLKVTLHESHIAWASFAGPVG